MNNQDYIEIQNLIHYYPEYLDAGKLDKVGELFAPASVYFEGFDEPVIKDPQAIAALKK